MGEQQSLKFIAEVPLLTEDKIRARIEYLNTQNIEFKKEVDELSRLSQINFDTVISPLLSFYKHRTCHNVYKEELKIASKALKDLTLIYSFKELIESIKAQIEEIEYIVYDNYKELKELNGNLEKIIGSGSGVIYD